MKCFITGVLLLAFYFAHAQEYVIDYQHFVAVSQNAAVRSSAEAMHDQYLGTITNHIDDLNTNLGSVLLAQNMIYEGLSNVNSALKNGLAVKNITLIIADMTGYIDQALELAKGEPYLLIFAGKMSSEMRTRSFALASDVSGYVLKEGSNVLADYNSRDQLLHKVTTQLQILDGLAYGTWKAMYWAKERGMIDSLDPFANFITQDTRIVNQIIQHAKFLHQ